MPLKRPIPLQAPVQREQVLPCYRIEIGVADAARRTCRFCNARKQAWSPGGQWLIGTQMKGRRTRLSAWRPPAILPKHRRAVCPWPRARSGYPARPVFRPNRGRCMRATMRSRMKSWPLNRFSACSLNTAMSLSASPWAPSRIAERSRQVANPQQQRRNNQCRDDQPAQGPDCSTGVCDSVLIIRARTGATSHGPCSSLGRPGVLPASCRGSRRMSEWTHDNSRATSMR